jgi:hypothetical protein
MGLFDKIKSMANAVTGGAAKVSVEVMDARLSAPFDVVVRAQSQGSDVKYDRVYVKVESIEKVEVPDTDVVYEEDGSSQRKREIVRASDTIFAQEFVASGSGVVKANETQEWKLQVTLPSNAMPGYKGKYAEHYYRILVGLDCTGNDPDSGWNRFIVR